MLIQFLCLLLTFLDPAVALHLEGQWKPSQRYRFLAKFGFQRTQIDDLEATRGYVYGTVGSRDMNEEYNGTGLATLVLVDSEFILDLYGNATEPVWLRNVSGIPSSHLAWMIENERCRRMFAKINEIAWHKTCAPSGRMDLLRTVPCPVGKLCGEEDNKERVIPGSQFTYIVQDLRQPRFWYLMLVACSRNPQTCQWETTYSANPTKPSSASSTVLDYSIWMVNGAPHLQGFNKFEHQFSFETHETVEIHLVFLVLYLVLGAILHVKLFGRGVIHTTLFLCYIWISIFALLVTSIHLTVFSFDGIGLGYLSEFGTLLFQWADALFLVLLISTSQMGFIPPNNQDTQRSLKFNSFVGSDGSPSKAGHGSYAYHRLAGAKQTRTVSNNLVHNPQSGSPAWPFITLMICLFEFVQTLFYVWASMDKNPVIDVYVWNTVPGCLLLALRFGVSFWFLAILRRRLMRTESCSDKNVEVDARTFGLGIELVHFAAGFLLWMIVLPLVVFIAETSVSPLWRSKTILSVCLCANYVASCAYAYLLVSCSIRQDL